MTQKDDVSISCAAHLGVAAEANATPQAVATLPGDSKLPKVLISLYYDDFARFFCQVEDALREFGGMNVTYVVSNLSGAMYLKVHGRRKVVWIKPWRSAVKSPATWSSELKYIAAFPRAALGDLSSTESQQLLSDTVALRGNMLELLEREQPDVVVLSGDSRPAERAIKSVWNGPTLHFEQGPNGTTVLDKLGVNAGCSFRPILAGLQHTKEDKLGYERKARATRMPFYRVGDYILDAILGVAGVASGLQARMRQPKVSVKAWHAAQEEQLAESVLFVLQVKDDANNIFHNPNQIDEMRLADLAQELAQNGIPCQFREHPLSKRRYYRDFYTKVTETPLVSLSGRTLQEDLEKASCVVTINSTTGMDAYRLGKKVFVLGESYWDRLPSVARIEDADLLPSAVTAFLNSPKCNNLEVQPKIFHAFCRTHLIPGHFRDEKSEAPKLVAKKIKFAANGTL